MSVASRNAKSFDLLLFCSDFDRALMLRRKPKENDDVAVARHVARAAYDLMSAVKTTMFER
jgi:hypothetical protein